MRELVRRLLMAVFLFTGLWLAATPATELFRVEPVDWRDEMARRKDRAAAAVRTLTPMVGEERTQGLDLAPETRGPVAAFIAHQTEGRLVTVSGPRWEGFFNRLADARLGRFPDAGWRSRAAVGFCKGDLFFRTDEGPMGEIRNRFDADHPFNYVRVDSPARPAYLKVNLTRTDDILSCAPAHLAYPDRHTGIALLLAALIAYVVVRRRRPGPNSVIYSSARAGWFPDLVAAVVVGLFFALPIFITAQNMGGIFKPGWVFITLALWLMGAIFASIWVVSLKYMSFRIDYDADGFDICVWGFIRRRYRYADVRNVAAHVVRAPKWLKRLLWLASLVSWRAAGQALLMEREDPALRIHTADGKQYTLVLMGLLGGATFVRVMADAGVAIDPEALSWLPEPSDAELAETASRPSRIAGAVVSVLLAGALSVFLFQTTHPPEPVFADGAFAETAPFQLPEKKERRVTFDMIARQDAVIKKMALENERLKAVTRRAETAATTEERQALLKESQEILGRVRALQAEFEAIRAEGEP